MFLEKVNIISTEQHGFRAGRSTGTAYRRVLEKMEEALQKIIYPLFMIFVDFRTAFNTGSREAVLLTSLGAGEPNCYLAFLRALLQPNIKIIDDAIQEHEPITQSTGFAQGDCLSSLLFSTNK